MIGDDEIATIFSSDAELKRLLKVEASWTRALGNIEGAPEAENVAQTIETLSLEPEDLTDGFARDGVVVPALVKAIKSAIGLDLESFVHNGLTSQDVIDTAMILASRDAMTVLSKRLIHLDQNLSALFKRFGDTQLTPFTRMQPALNCSTSTVIERWRQPIPRLLKDCDLITEQLSVIQWGGPIGTRDHAKSQALGAAFAKELDLVDPGEAWHTDRTRVSDTVNLMARISVLTGKLGEDIALMAAMGPGHIALAGGKSSAMPHKNNPVKAEVLIALSDLAATYHSGLTRSGRHEGFRSGQAWTLEWLLLPQMYDVAGTGLNLAATLLNEIETLGR
ncbi:MAG: lyase family protein [Pseudomonadota bacterium]